MKLTLLCLSALSMMACSNADTEQTDDQAQMDASVSTKATSEPVAPISQGSDAPSSKPKANNKAVPSHEFTSNYTDLKKAQCKTIELDEEGAGFIREQCGEFNGVPLFRTEGDLRQSAYAGNEPSGQTTISPFNYLGDMVEWRMQAGKPIALIYRLRADAPDMPGNGKTQLFVQKIGIGTDKSCIIGMVAGNYPKANERAREIADAAATIICNDGVTPKTLGDLL